jgi:transcriptional regulator with XRE-family HTH domain
MLDLHKLKESRLKKGLTQTQAASAVGMSLGRWNDIESGRRANVSLKTLDRIARALGMDPKDLLK